MQSELSDGRVRVRRYRLSDAERLLEAARESVREVSPWLPWCHRDLSLEEIGSWVEKQIGEWDEGREFQFAIEEIPSARYVGGAGLNRIDPVNRRANLGFWIRTSATGKGFATSAARLISSFGFEELGLLRIEILVAAENEASQRVAQKLGALQEGVLRNRLFLHGRSHDAAVHSLTAETSATPDAGA